MNSPHHAHQPSAAGTTSPATPQHQPGPLAGRTWPMRLLLGFGNVLLLAVTAMGAVTIVATQVGFYAQHMRVKTVPELWGLNLTLITPLAAESIVWSCTFMAMTLTLANRTNRLWMSSMWGFASLAALVNATHSAEQSDILGGIVTGGMSLAIPFVVHLWILWMRHMATGMTLGESRQAAAIRWAFITRRGAQVVLHPLRSPRAFWYWTSGLYPTWDAAFRATLVKGGNKAMKKLISEQFMRSLEPQFRAAYSIEESQPAAAAADTRRNRTETTLGDIERGGVLTAEAGGEPTVDIPDLAQLDDPGTFAAIFGRPGPQESPAVHGDSTHAPVHSAHPHNHEGHAHPETHTESEAEPRAQADPTHEESVRARTTASDNSDARTPRSSRAHPPGERAHGLAHTTTPRGPGSMKKRVIEHYHELVRDPHTDVHTVNVRQVMDALDAPEQSRTNISRVWNECLRGEHDNPKTANNPDHAP